MQVLKKHWYWVLATLAILAAILGQSIAPSLEQELSPDSEEPETIAAVITWDEWREVSDPNQLDLTDELVAELLDVEYDRVGFMQYQLETPEDAIAPLGIVMARIEDTRTLAQITVDGLPYLESEDRYAVWLLEPLSDTVQLLGPLVPLADQEGSSPAWELLYGTGSIWNDQAQIVVTREQADPAPTSPSDPILLIGSLNKL